MGNSFQTSIVIPTYNRADILLRCLEAVSHLKSDANYEVVVVDNASTDNTRELCLAFRETHPAILIRYAYECLQGVSHARNRGVEEAQGEIVCFLDDDSPPAPEWLDALLKPFSDPQVGCAGGPSILDYQGHPIPDWLKGDLKVYLSAYGLPYEEPTQVSEWKFFPLSCNLAIRRCLFNSLGYFRTDLDRSGNQVLAAGDTEMIARIHRAGWKVMYVPDAKVNHLVSPNRLKKEHIYRIGRGLAKSHILLTADRNPLRILRWFASDMWYAARMFMLLIVAVLRQKPLWFDDYMRFWIIAIRIPLRLKSLI